MLIAMSLINLSEHNTERVQVSLNNLVREVLIVVIAFTYAYILMSLPLFEFIDRESYLNNAQYSDSILGINQAKGILTLIFNEPIWFLINTWLRSILDPENVIRTIIFTASFLSSYSFIKLSNSKIRNILLMVIFLLLPIILKNYITHLRQGLAIGLFMLGMLFSDWRRIAFVVVTPFIHISWGLEKMGFDVQLMPLSSYRYRSFYVMRNDALDRFGTKLEKRFSRNQIQKMLESSGLYNISFSDTLPYHCAIGYKIL